MSKPKFNPIISKVELNPEQAVLNCTCYSRGRTVNRGSTRTALDICTTRAACAVEKTFNNRYASTFTSSART